MSKFNKGTFLKELTYFSGSEVFYKNPLFKRFVYTEGVRYLAQEAECYWLLDFIYSYQITDELKHTNFQTWKIIIRDNRAIIKVTGGEV